MLRSRSPEFSQRRSATPRIPAHDGPALADRAMELLRENVADGYRRTDACRTEDAPNSVRGRPDFRLLIMDLDVPG